MQDDVAYSPTQGITMSSSDYRIESSVPVFKSLLPLATFSRLYADRSLAVAVAVKSVSDPTRQQVRVVHVPSGEIVFDTTPAPLI